jgi:superfamily II DNA/RNA helicase
MFYHSVFPHMNQIKHDNPDRHLGMPVIHVCDVFGAAKGFYWKYGSPLHQKLYNKVKTLKGNWNGSAWELTAKSAVRIFCEYAQGLGAIVLTNEELQERQKSAKPASEIWLIGKDIWLYDLGRLPIQEFVNSLHNYQCEMAGSRVFTPDNGDYVCWIGSRHQAKILVKTFALSPRRVSRKIGGKLYFKQNGNDISFRMDPRKNPLQGHLLLGSLQIGDAYSCNPENMILPVAMRALSNAPAWSRPSFSNQRLPIQPALISVAPDDVPGYCTPCPAGHVLHKYQKEGVRFVTDKAGRALIADEMGLGKTAEAIISAQVLGARRILVVSPSGLTRSWRQEVQDWSGETGLLLGRNSSSANMKAARWLIIGYDQLVQRTHSWNTESPQEKIDLLTFLIRSSSGKAEKFYKDLLKKVKQAVSDLAQDWLNKYYTKKAEKELRASIDIFEAMPVPHLYAANPEQKRKWEAISIQLERHMAFISAIENLDIDFLVVDEAHRIKNIDAKRSTQVLSLATKAKYVLLLTGTPIRNEIQDLDTLITAIYGSQINLNRDSKKEQTVLAKHYLDQVMIRRLKKDVLPQLPPKIRQAFPIELEGRQEDNAELVDIVKTYQNASDESAWLAAISRARHLIGRIKINSSGTIDVLKTVFEEKGSAVVFTYHKDVAEAATKVINDLGFSSGLISGDTPLGKRAEIVCEFQNKKIDSIVATISAAGEGITLHRTDTVIFLEYDWVPASMWQAEDRIHRVGQTAESCYVIYVPGIIEDNYPNIQSAVAWESDIEEEDCDDLVSQLLNLDSLIQKVLTRKLSLINEVHDEDNVLFPSEQSILEEVKAALPRPHGFISYEVSTDTDQAPKNRSGYVKKWRFDTGRTKQSREEWLEQHSAESAKPWLAEGISRATWYRMKNIGQ